MDQTTPSKSTESECNQTDQTLKDLCIRKKLNEQLKEVLKEEDPDFALMIGIGSQVLNTANTDYTNKSNVLATTSLGRETPQLLTGVAFRTHIPNFFFPRYVCHLVKQSQSNLQNEKSKDSAKGATQSGKQESQVECTNKEFLKNAETWQKRPWSTFVSLKFAPGASETLNGFVFGGSYSFAKYINALVGFTLTPINVPSPGLRTTAAQFVTQQQKQGFYLNFNPQAMLANAPNAFDGFPLTDNTGKLIYPGNPLALNYRAGVIFGVSIPIYFKSVF